MATPKSRCPAWLIQLYGAALYLYPKSFRETYHSQMLQVFVDKYQRQQKSNPALFLLETINDLGASMSQEHYSRFSQHGRIRMAFAGLIIALGILAMRPLLTESLTNGFVFVGDFDQRVDTLLYSHYADHRREIADGLLNANDPIAVMAGAQTYSDMRWDANSKMQTHSIAKARVERALKTASDNPLVLLAAYPVCAANPDSCNAETVLSRLQTIAPQNGMTWLYAASAANERGDFGAQEIYLAKANAAGFFDDPQNMMNASLHHAYVKNQYELPWYSFMSKENHAIAEWFVLPIENYSVPGCMGATKSTASIQILCGDIAKRIAAQPSSNLTMRLMATSLAVQLGVTELQPELDLLRLQHKTFSETVWNTDLVLPDELAKAYGDGKQYDLALKAIEKYTLHIKNK